VPSLCRRSQHPLDIFNVQAVIGDVLNVPIGIVIPKIEV
jgi:hypothetical protein